MFVGCMVTVPTASRLGAAPLWDCAPYVAKCRGGGDLRTSRGNYRGSCTWEACACLFASRFSGGRHALLSSRASYLSLGGAGSCVACSGSPR